MYRILEMEWRGVRREKEGKRRGLIKSPEAQ